MNRVFIVLQRLFRNVAYNYFSYSFIVPMQMRLSLRLQVARCMQLEDIVEQTGINFGFVFCLVLYERWQGSCS